MLQLIGLIVAAYALARLLQVPLEIAAVKDEWRGTQFLAFAIVVCVSVVGLLCVAALAVFLLMWDSAPPSF